MIGPGPRSWSIPCPPFRPSRYFVVPAPQVGSNIEIIIDPFAIANLEPIQATADMQATLNDAAQRLEAYCARK